MPYCVPNVSVKNSTETAVAIATRTAVMNFGKDAGRMTKRKACANDAPSE